MLELNPSATVSWRLEPRASSTLALTLLASTCVGGVGWGDGTSGPNLVGQHLEPDGGRGGWVGGVRP